MNFDPEARFEGRDLVCLRGGRLVFLDLTFEVPAGGALLLVGPNGSGKSSLMRLMAGLLTPMSGQILWNSRPVTDEFEDHAARQHYVGHLDAVKATLTAGETLSFWANQRGQADPAQIAAALNSFGIGAQRQSPGRFLSSGQRRRLALSRLIASPAQLWLLDEPTVGLDTAGVAALEGEIKRHREAGGMVIAATHLAIDMGPDCKTLNVGDFIANAEQTVAAAVSGHSGLRELQE